MANIKDQRGRGWFFLAIAVMLFAMYSLAIAASTGEDCGDRGLGREWQIFPPEWECTGTRGFG